MILHLMIDANVELQIDADIERKHKGRQVKQTVKLLDKLFCHYVPVLSDSLIFHYFACRPPTSMLFG